MNHDSMISDVEHLLGRVINSRGEPIDGHGAISGAARLPLHDELATQETKDAASPVSLFETGIKVIDLLAPVPRGGIFAMYSTPGLGKLVVQQEMIHNLTTHSAPIRPANAARSRLLLRSQAERKEYDSYVVGIGMDESSYDASELVAPLEDFSDKNRMVLVFEQMSDSQEIIQRLIRVGLTVAIELRHQGHEVMFVVDKNVVAKVGPSTLSALKRVIQEQGLITLLLTPEEDGVQHDEENDVLNVLDAQIFFSRELAKQNTWPAVDRMKSTSRLLESSRGDGLPRPIEEHRQVARQVRELLQRYAASQATSTEDQQMVKRTQRVQLFLTQPFFVAEAFSDIPGEFVPLAETLKGCKELLEGRYDDVPVEAFRFVGTIEQALTKAKVLGG
jgi:F-type H+-transporting ATPase subunit beta